MREISELEKLVSELRGVWFSASAENRADWNAVAKHVQRMVVEAKIEEVKSWQSIPGWARCERITELTKRLEELK